MPQTRHDGLPELTRGSRGIETSMERNWDGPRHSSCMTPTFEYPLPYEMIT